MLDIPGRAQDPIKVGDRTGSGRVPQSKGWVLSHDTNMPQKSKPLFIGVDLVEVMQKLGNASGCRRAFFFVVLFCLYLFFFSCPVDSGGICSPLAGCFYLIYVLWILNRCHYPRWWQWGLGLVRVSLILWCLFWCWIPTAINNNLIIAFKIKRDSVATLDRWRDDRYLYFF